MPPPPPLSPSSPSQRQPHNLSLRTSRTSPSSNTNTQTPQQQPTRSSTAPTSGDSSSSQLERRTVVSCLLFPEGSFDTASFHEKENVGNRHDEATTKERQVLLFKRSEKVSTYRGKLGPIAGSVEFKSKATTAATDLDNDNVGGNNAVAQKETPLEAAWRELEEETGWGEKELEFLWRGKEFTFGDERAIELEEKGDLAEAGRRGRLWTVCPFAFRLRGPLDPDGGGGGGRGLKLKMNFEHDGYEWCPVDDLLSGNMRDKCVPRLEVTMSRVWIEPGSVLAKGLKMLKDDHKHGARELGTMAMKTLVEIVDRKLREEGEIRVADVDTWWKDLRMQAWHIVANGRPSMGAAISSAVVRALGGARRDVLVGGFGVGKKVLDGLKRAVQERSDAGSRVGERFAEVLGGWFDGGRTAAVGGTELGSPGGPLVAGPGDVKKGGGDGEQRWVKILTLSSSSTIRGAILRSLDDDERRRIELRVLESRPLFEGVSMAKSLVETVGRTPALSKRLKIVLASDASVGVLAKDADVVLIGADRISDRGDISNKTGSLSAVLTAKTVTKGKAVVVCISELEKIASPGSMEEHREEDNDPEEVLKAWGGIYDQTGDEGQAWKEMVKIRNVYFEWVPSKEIDCYVCETGFATREDIGRYSRRVEELEGEMFGDL